MNRVHPIAWASAGRDVAGPRREAGRVPTELLILAVATAGQLFGALTNPIAGALLAMAIAVLLTVRHMRAEVRDLHAWEASQPGSLPDA
jgi:hypothetical protein